MKLSLPGISALDEEVTKRLKEDLGSTPSLVLATALDRIFRSTEHFNGLLDWCEQCQHSMIAFFWQGPPLSSRRDPSFTGLAGLLPSIESPSDLLREALNMPNVDFEQHGDIIEPLFYHYELWQNNALAGQHNISNPFFMPTCIRTSGIFADVILDHILAAAEFVPAFQISSAQGCIQTPPSHHEDLLFKELFSNFPATGVLNRDRADKVSYYLQVLTGHLPTIYYATFANGALGCHCRNEEDGIPENHDPECVCPCETCYAARALLCPHRCQAGGDCACHILCVCVCSHCHRKPLDMSPAPQSLPTPISAATSASTLSSPPPSHSTQPHRAKTRNRAATGPRQGPKETRHRVQDITCRVSTCANKVVSGKKFCAEHRKCHFCDNDRLVKCEWCSRDCYGRECDQLGQPPRVCSHQDCNVPCPPGSGTVCDLHARRYKDSGSM